jgi:soluble lytic murein transglycosylase-like protein
MTASAIRDFQRSAGLEADGLPGPRTRRALGRLGRPLFGTRPLAQGAIGWDVSVLQFLLGWHGLAPPHVNGNFGAGTRAAVVRFQRRMRLHADGIVGPATRAALLNRGSTSQPTAPRPRPRYVVRVGDTLTSIASRYGTTVPALARANRLSPRGILVVGRRLVVPARAASPAGASSANVAEVRAAIDRWAAHYSVNPHLARALAWQESGFQSSIKSSAGAWGVMQVTPATWKFVETVLIGFRIPRTMDGNVRVGIAYLRHLLQVFRGNERLAIGGYYQGPWAVKKRGLYPETKRYVANVLALKSRL